MTTQTSSTSSLKNIQAADIRTLVQHQGKITQAGGTQIILKTPSSTDPVLLAIIKDPKFTAKAVGTPSAEGTATYEVSGNGKTAKIQVSGTSSY